MESGSIVMIKITRKYKVNGFEVSEALAMLGIIVLNIVHVVHE